LGRPLANATASPDGMSFSREFERASVRVSCETGEGTIETK
jgi:hypothetical protein